MSRRSSGALLAFACAALGCARDPKVEAVPIVHAVEELREATREDRPVLLARLRSLPCTDPRVCALRNGCVQAYEHVVRAEQGVEKTRREVERGDASTESPEQLLLLLDQSQRELGLGKEGATRCADDEAALRRELGL